MYLKNLPTLLLLISRTKAAIGNCYEPEPSFPTPKIPASLFKSSNLSQKFDSLISQFLKSPSPSWSPENSSFAIQLTSNVETLWSSYYTAPHLGNYTDGDPTPVSGDTAFRIASCSKTFTVYALLLQEGISLEDPITKFLPELKGERSGDRGTPVDWDSVSIRSLASQLSGIGRGNGNSDLAFARLEGYWEDPVSYGLPEISANDSYLLPCMKTDEDRACTRSETIQIAKNMYPIFSPNDRSSYSNIAFSLLGLALENITSQTYTQILQKSLLTPLNMTSTTTTKPPDSQGIIPVGFTSWSQDLGPDTPSGGIYTTSNDLSKYLRSILTNSLLPKSVINYWMKPHSWTSSRTNSAYGMPWEILRTMRTPDGHPVDVVTKGGSLAGYYSTIALLPAYGVGVSLLSATPDQAGLFALREVVIGELIGELDGLVRGIVRGEYEGVYSLEGNDLEDNHAANSSITIKVDDKGPGLLLTSWILNNTDFLPSYGLLKQMPKDLNSWEARLIPTNVEDGRTWRLTAILKKEHRDESGIFSDYCFTDVDGIIYGGWSLEEFSFSKGGEGEGMKGVRIQGARTELVKRKGVQVAGGGVGAEQVVLRDGGE